MQVKYQNANNKNILAKNGITYVYREFGQTFSDTTIPVIFFNHLAATLENIDPRIVDELGKHYSLIAFDNTGVGGSSGKVPTNIEQMADDAICFIEALGIKKFHIFGFSMGGMVAQEIVEKRPELIEKIILTGTCGRGGEGIADVYQVTFADIFRGFIHRINPKRFLFFPHTPEGKENAIKFLNSIDARKENRDKDMSVIGFLRQLIALNRWGKKEKADLSKITQPTLIANGDHDRMVPTSNSYDLHKRIKGSELIIYPEAGHGGIFQNYSDFSRKAIEFLQK